MMRALWTSASGMISQQANVDTISHNLANVNTAGYKAERMEFKSLLYQTMQRADLDRANRTGRPVNLQVGLGVRPIAVSRDFGQGSFQSTRNPMDITLNGKGFFVVRSSLDTVSYTKDGAFKLSISEDGGDNMLCTAEGYPVLNLDDEPIYIPANIPDADIQITPEGYVLYLDRANGGTGATIDTGFQIKLVQFANPNGLEAVGSNLYNSTVASGDELIEADGEVAQPSRLVQFYLEMSNVQVATEMVNLIVAQRAYELNSKGIQASDEMLQQANNLRR